MERRKELMVRARELERGGRAEEALGLYLQLAEQSDATPPPILKRIGEIQLDAGQREEAADSLERALSAFAASGQLNNAIAVARRLFDADLQTPELQLRLGEMAIEKGYRGFARDAIAAYVGDEASAGEYQRSISPLSAFLVRFPDDRDLLRRWVDELLRSRGDADAVAALDRLADAVSENGGADAAAGVEAEIDRLRPAAKPTEPARTSAERPRATPPETLPLMSGAPEAEAEEPAFATLEGLEPTIAGGWDDEDPHAAAAAPEAAEAEDEEEGEAEPLPLLGVGPEVEPPAARDAATPELPEPDPWEAPASSFDTSFTASEAADVAEESEPDLQQAIAELLRFSSREVERADDPSTHYDMGLAYKQMGLADEAIAHFAAALERGHDPVAIMEVLGEVLVTSDQHRLAADLLRAVRGTADLDSIDLIGIHYWLARSEEALGRHDEARLGYRRVTAIDPSFRDAAQRRDLLERSL